MCMNDEGKIKYLLINVLLGKGREKKTVNKKSKALIGTVLSAAMVAGLATAGNISITGTDECEITNVDKKTTFKHYTVSSDKLKKIADTALKDGKEAAKKINSLS